MGIESTGMNLGVPSRALGQYCPDPGVGGVHLHDELTFGVGVNKDRGGGESLLEEPESLLGLDPPLKPQLVRGEPGQGGGDGAVVPDEPAVEVGEAQKPLEASAVRGCRPLLHCLDLLRIHPHISGGNDVPQEVGLGAGELTFLGLHEQAVLQESLQDQPNMGLVLFRTLGEDEDVIQVDEGESVDHVPEDVIDEGLEDGRGVKPKGITRYSQCPVGVLNAVFHSSPSLIRTR